MPCYKPLHGYNKPGGGFTANHSASNTIPLTIPCGQCIGCRTDKKLEWAVRLVHESRVHTSSIFVTLTYDDANVPIGYGLDKRHAQLFLKRLRKRIAPTKIRFFLVGEYGDQSKRPHYHAIIFGWEPPDARVYSQGANPLYLSKLLDQTWGKGNCLFGYADPEACKYVSHYTVKRITGPMSKDHYTRLDEFGELHQVIPEFSLMSRRPGLGANFYLDNKNDFRSGDFALMLGRKQKIPAYYDKLLKREKEKDLELLKLSRKRNSRKHKANNTPERLVVRETIAKAKLSFNSNRKDIPQ